MAMPAASVHSQPPAPPRSYLPGSATHRHSTGLTCARSYVRAHPRCLRGGPWLRQSRGGNTKVHCARGEEFRKGPGQKELRLVAHRNGCGLSRARGLPSQPACVLCALVCLLYSVTCLNRQSATFRDIRLACISPGIVLLASAGMVCRARCRAARRMLQMAVLQVLCHPGYPIIISSAS